MAYQQYFIETTWTFMPTLLLCLFLLMSMSHVISYEYQNHANLVTQLTLKGRKPVLKIKLGLSLLIGFIFLMMTMFPSLFLLQQKYGFASLSASATSIQDFAIFPSWISIGMICLASFVLKNLVVISIIVIIHVVGVKTKNSFTNFIYEYGFSFDADDFKLWRISCIRCNQFIPLFFCWTIYFFSSRIVTNFIFFARLWDFVCIRIKISFCLLSKCLRYM